MLKAKISIAADVRRGDRSELPDPSDPSDTLPTRRSDIQTTSLLESRSQSMRALVIPTSRLRPGSSRVLRETGFRAVRGYKPPRLVCNDSQSDERTNAAIAAGLEMSPLYSPSPC